MSMGSLTVGFRPGEVKPWVQVPAQDGRTVIVTGATSGIGLVVAKILVHRGAHVIVAARNLAKAAEVTADFAGLRGSWETRELDVASLASVRRFAAGIDSADVLINNAGVLGTDFGLTEDGIETQFATNHLGHFALTNLLLPRLRDRVVVTGSLGHRGGQLDLDDLTWTRREYTGDDGYTSSKLANLLFLAELQRRLTAAGSTLRVTGAHPGFTNTNITQSSGSPFFRWLGRIGQPMFGMPTWRGALPTLYAATMDVPGNTYIGPHGPGEMHGWPSAAARSQEALDPALARRTWEVSAELSGVDFPW